MTKPTSQRPATSGSALARDAGSVPAERGVATPLDRGTPRRPGASGSAPKQRGFTLIEVVAAFAILALGLALTMQIAVGGMRQARQAADYSEAALLAQSLLDTVGVGEPLELGETRGEWEGDFRWTLNVLPYEPEAADGVAGVDPLTSPVRLVELDLVVSWEHGGNRREARFRSLRAMLPESL
jgi:general secretion pathway protein I